MKFNYIGTDTAIQKKLEDFEERINLNSDISNCFNDDKPINIEFYDTFDNLEELNSDSSVDKESIKNDYAFCSIENHKIYVKNSSLSKEDEEFNFMLSHEVGHILIKYTKYYIPHKVGACPQNIQGKRFKEELADFLGCKWGFREGFEIDRISFKGQDYIDCFVEDEKKFAEKIYRFKNLQTIK